MSHINYEMKRRGFIKESRLYHENLSKYESVFNQGNGYLGIRGVTEELTKGDTRNIFIAGVYNKAFPQEISELANSADFLNIEVLINGIPIDTYEYKNYQRNLNLENGELTRTFDIIEENFSVQLKFKRFVSLSNLHLICQEVEIVNIGEGQSVDITVESNINGHVTNDGSQHFLELEKMVYDHNILQYETETSTSNIKVLSLSANRWFKNKVEDFNSKNNMRLKRRLVSEMNTMTLEFNESFEIKKYSTVHTSFDKQEYNKEKFIDELIKNISITYEDLLKESENAWKEKVWNYNQIIIDSDDDFDQLAINYTQYQLTIMTPFHDDRMSIAAKGLSGMGYKGHVFWDTEVFILPYFIAHYPKQARNLLMYRWHTLPGAQQKARENGYDGAMYPWESASLDDAETAPKYWEIDINTGKPTRLYTGELEQHITASVTYGLFSYIDKTKDFEFLKKYGQDILRETSKFWISRLEYNNKKDCYEINDVIGPDEYTERIDNNAYTNYLVDYHFERTLEMNDKGYISLEDSLIKEIIAKKSKLYLPNFIDDILPQDDTYLDKPKIDLRKYKEHKDVNQIFKAYSLSEINELQVSKQADVIQLAVMLPHLFNEKQLLKNWEYYLETTLHDSSLSYSAFAIIACKLGRIDIAYEFFKKTCRIDLGSNLDSSDVGIHAASLSTIWVMMFEGFAGISLNDEGIQINPHLPKEWKSVSFKMMHQNKKYHVNIKNSNEYIINEEGY